MFQNSHGMGDLTRLADKIRSRFTLGKKLMPPVERAIQCPIKEASGKVFFHHFAWWINFEIDRLRTCAAEHGLALLHAPRLLRASARFTASHRCSPSVERLQSRCSLGFT
jgi:hypothetical protein